MPRSDKLWQRIEAGTKPELENLSKIIRLDDPEQKPKDVLVKELSACIRAAAGHSVRNLFRRDPHAFPYKQMLIDVADKMAPGRTSFSWTPYRLNDHHPEEEIEENIWKFFEQKMEEKIRKLPSETREKLRAATAADLRRLGYSEALVSQVGAGLVGGTAGALIGPALAYQIALSTASGFGWLQLYWVGHVGTAVAVGAGAGTSALLFAPLFVWWLGNAAYRKTIPATLELIKIRKVRALEETFH